MAKKKKTFDLSEAIDDIHEAMNAFDFDALEDVEHLDQIRFYIRDMFIDANEGIPFPWEELAALAVVGLAKNL